jgi:multidrug resistance efflux pump
MPSTFTGEVQATVSIVSSSKPGLLSNTTVRQFDRVTKGQVLAKIAIQSSEAVSIALATIRADLEVTKARMTFDQHRNDQNSQSLELNYEQLLAERMDQKAALDQTLFEVRFLQSELVRTQESRSDEYIKRMMTQLKEREELIKRLDKTLELIKPTGPAANDAEAWKSIETAIKAQEAQLQEASEVTLIAPIDGVVTKVLRNSGENIAAGEPLLMISGDHAESIVGYVRQPLSFDPKAGDKVVVRTRRGVKREAAEAQIVQVGGRMEFFAQSLRVRGFDSSQERGLPVLITIPNNLKLHPGELVDLALKN